MTLLNALRAIHVSAGAWGLLIGPLAMYAAKYGRIHRLGGKAFVWGMVVVVVTAVVLAVLTSKIFLFVVAVFSGYLALSGWRTVRRRGSPGTAIDYVLLSLFGGAALWMALLATRVTEGRIILITFAMVMAAFLVRQAMTLPKRVPAHVWIPLHLSSMLGSYVAALTAFSATQLAFIRPLALQWLWPTALGVPLIVWTSIRWKQKLRSQAASAPPPAPDSASP